MDKFIQY